MIIFLTYRQRPKVQAVPKTTARKIRKTVTMRQVFVFSLPHWHRIHKSIVVAIFTCQFQYGGKLLVCWPLVRLIKQ